ncbi:MAG: aminopeptidase P N-terminal domain-containing protein [Bacteroidales bacterium]|nr:aminopeptidase P N-terminal domain-containing protein [Bacteroidales bacterium]MCF8455932.1 aminopeptidase P N-terminal domain-containing protein [Bacteroidales bacterium]
MEHVELAKDFFIRNRKKLQKKLKKNSLVILHSNDEMPRNGDQFFPFRQNSELFYLSGLEQEKTILCFYPDHSDEKMREIAFIIEAEKSHEIWYGHKYTIEEATYISGIDTVKFLKDFDSILRELLLQADQVYLFQNEYPKFSTDVPERNLRNARQLIHDYPTVRIERLGPVLTGLRVCKEPEEIEQIKEACRITKQAFHRVLSFVKPKVFEYQVDAEITHEFLWNGCKGHAYAPIVAAGKNACTLHYVSNKSVCQDGDLLLLDFGAEYRNYAADCSRTIPVNGKFSKRQRECYEAVLRVFKKAKQLFVPGNSIKKVNNTVNKWMEDEMITLGLFTKEEVEKQDERDPLYKKYFMHGTSHFLGLDVHDVGEKDRVFEKGMVLTCEPGLYIEGEGIGIRIENDIMVDEIPVDLMADIPVEVDDIERLMKSYKLK